MPSELKGWLTKRRETKVINLLGKHTSFVVDATNELFNALKNLKENKVNAAIESIERVIHYEKEADNLDRQISAELAKGELPPKDREDLFALVRRVDFVADWAKDAAVNLKILLERNFNIEEDVLKLALKMADLNKKCALTLRKAIDYLLSDIEKSLELVAEVERMEHEIDLIYYDAKSLLTNHPGSPGAIIILRDMLNDIERSSDLAEDASDLIKVIAIRFK